MRNITSRQDCCKLSASTSLLTDGLGPTDTSAAVRREKSSRGGICHFFGHSHRAFRGMASRQRPGLVGTTGHVAFETDQKEATETFREGTGAVTGATTKNA